jgi:hypothetical protein
MDGGAALRARAISEFSSEIKYWFKGAIVKYGIFSV